MSGDDIDRRAELVLAVILAVIILAVGTAAFWPRTFDPKPDADMVRLIPATACDRSACWEIEG